MLGLFFGGPKIFWLPFENWKEGVGIADFKL